MYRNSLWIEAVKVYYAITRDYKLTPASLYRAFQIGCQNHKITVISRASERDKMNASNHV